MVIRVIRGDFLTSRRRRPDAYVHRHLPLIRNIMKKTIHLLGFLLLLGTISQAQNAITWNNGMALAPASSGNEHPRMAVDRSGNPLVIWHHASRCMFSRWNGTAFTTPVIINPVSITVAGASWMGPDIAAHGDTVYVVFKQTPEHDDTAHIYCLHSYNGGITFSAPVQVEHLVDNRSRFPTVNTDDSGNPIVGFMKFDATFGDARWAVARSNDFGNSFSTDVKASGWSAANATVCDCCPGAICCSGNNVAMLYRDNNANLRDCWAGISTDNADSFSSGIAIDQQQWLINACPSTGPDGVMIGDTIYSTFANSASGKSLVYYNKMAVTDLNPSKSAALTGLFTGLSQQNYPRIATDGKAMAIAWMQIVNGNRQCVLRFTNNLLNGFPAAYDTVDLNDITNTDVAISHGKIYVVWEDDNSGTVQYRSGIFMPTSGIQENVLQNRVSIFPNPTTATVNITSDKVIDKVLIVNIFGQIIYQMEPNASKFTLELEQSGMYFVELTANHQTIVKKLMVAK